MNETFDVVKLNWKDALIELEPEIFEFCMQSLSQEEAEKTKTAIMECLHADLIAPNLGEQQFNVLFEDIHDDFPIIVTFGPRDWSFDSLGQLVGYENSLA
jgi:hypothetical protein